MDSTIVFILLSIGSGLIALGAKDDLFMEWAKVVALIAIAAAIHLRK